MTGGTRFVIVPSKATTVGSRGRGPSWWLGDAGILLNESCDKVCKPIFVIDFTLGLSSRRDNV